MRVFVPRKKSVKFVLINLNFKKHLIKTMFVNIVCNEVSKVQVVYKYINLQSWILYMSMVYIYIYIYLGICIIDSIFVDFPVWWMLCYCLCSLEQAQKIVF